MIRWLWGWRPSSGSWQSDCRYSPDILQWHMVLYMWRSMDWYGSSSGLQNTRITICRSVHNILNLILLMTVSWSSYYTLSSFLQVQLHHMKVIKQTQPRTCWMMWYVEEMKLLYLTVHMLESVPIIVDQMRKLESFAVRLYLVHCIIVYSMFTVNYHVIH